MRSINFKKPNEIFNKCYAIKIIQTKIQLVNEEY